MRHSRAILLAVSAVTQAGVWPALASSQAASDGARTFQETCAACHRLGGGRTWKDDGAP